MAKVPVEIRVATGTESEILRYLVEGASVSNTLVGTPEEDKRRKLHGMGLSDKQIADQCGVTREAIGHWRRSRGLPTNFPADGSGKSAERMVEVRHGH